jgi:hypothetical protein
VFGYLTFHLRFLAKIFRRKLTAPDIVDMFQSVPLNDPVPDGDERESDDENILAVMTMYGFHQ